MARETTGKEINGVLEGAACGALAGVLGFERRPLVSCDYAGDPRSGVVDALSTKVVDGRLVQRIVWYDNEWGYVNRLAELASMAAAAVDA